MRIVACVALAITLGGCRRASDLVEPADMALASDLADQDASAALPPTPVPVWGHCQLAQDGGVTLASDLAVPVSGATQAPNFRIDAAHTGAQPRETLTPPLTQAWSLDLGGYVNYALVANGRVFVTAGGGWPSVPGIVVAADTKTGALLWGPLTLGNDGLLAAYDGGRVFALGGGGLLVALDAANGATLWTRQLAGESFFQTPPVTSDGIVYVEGTGQGGIIYAVDERSGDVLWESQTFDGSDGTVTLWNGIVYDNEACATVYAVDGRSGALVWLHCTSCLGGGGSVPTAYGGRLYVREDPFDQNGVLDLLTGADVGMLPTPKADGALSLQDGRAYLLSFVNLAGELQAVDLSTGLAAWSVKDIDFVGSPIVAGNYVYAPLSTKTVEAFDIASGNLVWTGTFDDYVSARPEADSMTVGEGMLFVPVGHKLVAYR